MKSITFGSGGFVGFYLFGVASFLKEHYDTSHCQIGGVSAGACVATFMLAKDTRPAQEALLPYLLDSVEAAEPRVWKSVPRIIRGITGELGDVDYRRAFVAVSHISRQYPFVRSVVKDDFETHEELFDYVVLSSFVPIACGKLFATLDAKLYVDGALTTRAPIPPSCDQEDNLFITPSLFARKLSLRDSAQISRRKALRLYALGRYDASTHRDVFARLPTLAKGRF